MSKIINFVKKNIFILIVLIVSVPTFWRMLQPGMFSTQDFHIFRQLEFDKCVKALQIPCRWAPDAGLGYGEPIFNFYGQFSYAVGEIYHLLGGSIIGSVKFLFVLSLLGSGVSMFFLARRIWKNNYAALLSSAIYIYAPYRALDVWVRGALPEAFSFILFPLIILFIDRYIEKKKFNDIILFSLFLSVLIITHNLSLVMFVPFLAVWIIFKLYVSKNWKLLPSIALSLVASSLLSAFYILPVIFESKFIDLGSTITGYFDFHDHFVTSYELFVSNFWGYGASVWGPNDGLSLAVGYLQWILPVLTLAILLVKKEIFKEKKFLILFALGWFYLFLTHNKSTIIWEHLPFMAYIQFPWRFIGMAVFCFSLASGLLVTLFNKWVVWLTILICGAAIVLNFSFFRGDIWYKVQDSYFTTGVEWIRQRTASIADFWPNFGHNIPVNPSTGEFINYFPGWISSKPEVKGLILSRDSVFTDTPIRRIGNVISLVSLLGFISAFVTRKKWEKET